MAVLADEGAAVQEAEKKEKRRWLPYAVGLMATLLYAWTGYPSSLGGGDSGELLAEACIGGVAHPPGYPFYVGMLSLAPGKGQVFSSIFGGLAAGALCAATQIWTTDIGGLVAGTLFLTTPLVWEYSAQAEVFALNNAIVSLGILTFVVIKTEGQATWCGAVLVGLAASHQQAALLTAIPLALMAQRPSAICIFLAFVAFAVPQVCLVIRSARATEGSWGDLTSVAGWWRHVSRSEYGTFRLGAGTGENKDVLQRITAYLKWTLDQTPLVPAAAAMGFLSQRSIFLAWILYVGAWHGIWSNLPIFEDPMAYEVHARFWMQPHALLCCAAGAGVATIRLKERHVMIIFMAVIVGTVKYQNFHESGWAVHSHGEAVLGGIPRNGVLISYSDLSWNSVRYLRLCKKMRTDVTHVSIQLVPYKWFPRQMANYKLKFPTLPTNPSTNLRSETYAGMLEDLFITNRKKKLFVDMHGIYEPSIGDLGYWRRGLALIPWGLSYRVVNASKANYPKLFQGTVDELQNLGTRYHRLGPRPWNFREGSWERVVEIAFNDAHYQAGLWMLTLAQELRKQIDASTFPFYLRVLRTAAACTNINLPLTSSPRDHLKNSLLANVLLHSALETTRKLQLVELLNDGELQNVTTTARRKAQTFLTEHPYDNDAPVFAAFLNSTKEE